MIVWEDNTRRVSQPPETAGECQHRWCGAAVTPCEVCPRRLVAEDVRLRAAINTAVRLLADAVALMRDRHETESVDRIRRFLNKTVKDGAA